jgi:hypothetical protein
MGNACSTKKPYNSKKNIPYLLEKEEPLQLKSEIIDEFGE